MSMVRHQFGHIRDNLRGPCKGSSNHLEAHPVQHQDIHPEPWTEITMLVRAYTGEPEQNYTSHALRSKSIGGMCRVDWHFAEPILGQGRGFRTKSALMQQPGLPSQAWPQLPCQLALSP